MCGIAGIIGPDPGRPDILSAMLSEIAHRGPDGDGLWRARTTACMWRWDTAGYRSWISVRPVPSPCWIWDKTWS